MRRRLILQLLPAATLLSPRLALADPSPVSRVVVLDERFTIVGEVSSAVQLLEFSSAWSAKKRIERSSSDVDLRTFRYKLDVKTNDRASGGRWLYRPDGLVTKLDHAVKPLYEVADPKAFNALLGIERQGQ